MSVRDATAAEEIGAKCYDCGRKYGNEFGFPDMLVPNEVWYQITPTERDGGLLCPSCICKRLHERGLENVSAYFASGPCRIGPTSEAKHLMEVLTYRFHEADRMYTEIEALRRRCEEVERERDEAKDSNNGYQLGSKKSYQAHWKKDERIQGLLKLLQQCQPIVEAHNGGEHFMDGLDGRKPRSSDGLVKAIAAALQKRR